MQASTSTTAPREHVWSVLADLPDWPSWTASCTEVAPLDPSAPAGLGAAYRVRQPKLAPATWTITEWRPPESFTWTSSSPGVRSTGTHALRARPDGGTDITLGIEWSGPLAPIVRLLYGRRTDRYVAMELAGLARRSEERAADR